MNISVDGPGTGDGFVLFCEGKTDISDASRPIETEEVQACKKAGHQLRRAEDRPRRHHRDDEPGELRRHVPEPGRPLRAVRTASPTGSTRGTAPTRLAKQVGGTDSFPSAPLDITAPATGVGHLRLVHRARGHRGHGARRRACRRTRRRRSATTTSPVPNDNVIIQAMEGSDTPLGFVGFAYADQQGESIKKIEVDGGSGCVEPSSDTIADGSYPLSRSLYIYVNTDKLATNAALERIRRATTCRTRASRRSPTPTTWRSRATRLDADAGRVGDRVAEADAWGLPSLTCEATRGAAARKGSSVRSSSRRRSCRSSSARCIIASLVDRRAVIVPERRSHSAIIDVLLGKNWNPRQDEFASPRSSWGVCLSGGSRWLVAAPLGLASAIYLSEYARPAAAPPAEADRRAPGRRAQHRDRVLRARPSSAPELIQRLVSSASIFSLAAAGIGVGILTIPLVATIVGGCDARGAVRASVRRPSVSARDGRRRASGSSSRRRSPGSSRP